MASPKAKPMNPDAPSFYGETSKPSSHDLKLPHQFYHRQPPSGAEHWPPAPPQVVQSPVPLYLHPAVFFYKPPYMYYRYNIESQPQPAVYTSTLGDCGVAAAGAGGGAAKAAESGRVVKMVEGLKKGVVEKKRFDRTRFDFVRQRRAPKTTIMIKNIPNQYRRNMLLDFLDKHCKEQNQKANKLQTDPLPFAYDFVYLPMDFRSGDNLGYAFVNFTSAGAAFRFREILDKYKWGVIRTSHSSVYESRKICEITWARIQGKEELIKHFRNSEFPCNNLEYLPIVLSPARNGLTSITLPTTVAKCLVSVPYKPLKN